MGNVPYLEGFQTGHLIHRLCSRTSTKHEEKKVKVSAFIKGLRLRHFHGVTSPYVTIFPYSKHFYMTSKKTPCRNHFYPNTQVKLPHPLPRKSRITRLCWTLNFVDIRGQYTWNWMALVEVCVTSTL